MIPLQLTLHKMPSPRLICHWLSFFNHRIWLRSYGFNLFFLTKESKDNPSYTVNQFSMNSLLWNFYFSFFNFISLFCDAFFFLRGCLIYMFKSILILVTLETLYFLFCFIKLKVKLPNDPATPLLSVYPKGLKPGSQRGVSASVFITVLFAPAKIEKQLRCLYRMNR